MTSAYPTYLSVIGLLRDWFVLINNSRMTPQISFIIPLYNESEVLSKLVDRLALLTSQLSLDYEIILIDDGSKDDTPMMIRQLAQSDPHYQGIFFSRNFGHQYAVSAGLKYARGTEAVMILDGDLQDPPEMFHDFYEKYQEGFEVVFGIRQKRRENIFKRISYHLFYRILKNIANTPIDLDSGDFSLMSRNVVNILNSMPEESRFIRGMRSWVGFRQAGVEYSRDTRMAGEPKYTFSKLLKLAYDGIFNFSNFPVKLMTSSGLLCLAASLGYFIVTVFRKFIYGDVPVGFTALLFIIILFGGIQLISIGIIGEYVSRIFSQVKDRPHFIVKERIVDGKIIK
jgi:polyisoprenyl-phosphate glycosyltransferase